MSGKLKLLFVGVLIIGGASHCLAQEAPTKSGAAQAYTPQQLEYVGTLDKLLATQDYRQLTKSYLEIQDGTLIVPALDWGKSRMLAGGSLAVPLLYSTLLWKVGSDPQHADLRVTSGLIAMYSMLVANADGLKCADKTAASHRIDMITAQYRSPFQEIGRLPNEKKKQFIDIAIKIEQQTAPKRRDDNYLCRFGQQETADTVKKYGADRIQNVPTQPGQVGQQTVVLDDKDYVPQFLPRERWEKEQSETRAGFPAFLSKFLETVASR